MAIVKDLVCGRELDTSEMNQAVGTVPGGAPEVDPSKGTRRFHEGQWYYFCSLNCRSKFMASSETYTSDDEA